MLYSRVFVNAANHLGTPIMPASLSAFRPVNVRLLCAVLIAAAVVFGTAFTPAIAQDQAAESAIGGRFMLENHNGEIVLDQDFLGKYMLITFGYTYCPDVCPTNLVNMSTALEQLGDKADQIAPIFVTVDPERDTAERLLDYVKNFDERLIGLTGPQEMIDSIKSRYKVFSEIHRPQGWKNGDYTVDHTASIYLMSKEGKFLVKFAHGMDPVEMAKRISDFME